MKNEYPTRPITPIPWKRKSRKENPQDQPPSNQGKLLDFSWEENHLLGSTDTPIIKPLLQNIMTNKLDFIVSMLVCMCFYLNLSCVSVFSSISHVSVCSCPCTLIIWIAHITPWEKIFGIVIQRPKILNSWYKKVARSQGENLSF